MVGYQKFSLVKERQLLLRDVPLDDNRYHIWVRLADQVDVGDALVYKHKLASVSQRVVRSSALRGKKLTERTPLLEQFWLGVHGCVLRRLF